MKLTRDAIGMIPADYPKSFFRLSNWMSGAFVEDYSTEAEAVAASYASVNGTRYDHKVSKMQMVGA